MNIDMIQTKLSGRRDFAKKLGLASVGIAAFYAKVEAQTTISDSDILNFALNLEYLEAEFYTMATTGKYIGASGLTITGGGTAGRYHRWIDGDLREELVTLDHGATDCRG